MTDAALDRELQKLKMYLKPEESVAGPAGMAFNKEMLEKAASADEDNSDTEVTQSPAPKPPSKKQ
jgi:hypothetical protein